MLIDSHAHLAGEKFDGDRDAVLQRGWDAGLTHVVIIGETATAARDLARSDPTRLSFTAGVHPHEAHTFDAARDLLSLRARIADGAVAIGECGLDYFYDHSPRERQQAAFQGQLHLARESGLPVVVHTRQAEADTIRMMRAAAGDGVLGVLHCFTGSPAMARVAIDVGWYISISGIATFRTWERWCRMRSCWSRPTRHISRPSRIADAATSPHSCRLPSHGWPSSAAPRQRRCRC